MDPTIRYEFWNGQTSKKKKYNQYEGLVTTKHNPCLWTNIGAVCEDCSQNQYRSKPSEVDPGHMFAQSASLGEACTFRRLGWWINGRGECSTTRSFYIICASWLMASESESLTTKGWYGLEI